MNEIIGLSTDNDELLEDFKNNFPDANVINYKSIESIKRDEYSVLVIDSGIAGFADSIQFYLSKVRKKTQDTPVLLIFKVNNISELNTDWFFDDFVLYPFRRGELEARIKRLLWESSSDESTISIGNLKISLKEYTVYSNNQKMELTYKEFELLRLLVQNKGVVFSRKELLNKIWGMEYIGGTRTVDVHIRRLRGKLGDDFNSIIETVRNVGYKCKE
ncbi:MAG: response regulator transcription factor [bacterium]|nr:response regulator transcription factor [bacterium]